jgi:hypothetical protein
LKNNAELQQQTQPKKTIKETATDRLDRNSKSLFIKIMVIWKKQNRDSTITESVSTPSVFSNKKETVNENGTYGDSDFFFKNNNIVVYSYY